MSKINEMAISAVTSPRRNRADLEVDVRPRLDSFSASLPLTLADCSTGITPKSSPVNNVTPKAKPRTGALIGRASTFGILKLATPLGKMASRKRLDHKARTVPSAPPRNENRRLSIKNCCRRRNRPAPMATRTEISTRLFAARASKRLAIFTHAMNSTSTTAPDKASSGVRISPTSCCRTGSIHVSLPASVSGCCAAM